MKTYFKTLGLMFKKHFTRLISIILMVFVSIGFISGLGSSKNKINYSLTEYYQTQNVSDFIVKSKSQNGFLKEEIEKVQLLFEGADIDTGVSIDLKIGEPSAKRALRLYFLDFDRWNVNKPTIINGEPVTAKNQIYAENSDNVIKGYAIGEEIELDFKEILIGLSKQNNIELSAFELKLLENLQPQVVTVCGTIQSPLTFALDGEPSYNNPIDMVPNTTTGTSDMEVLENILYISKDLIPTYKDVYPSIPESMNKPIIGTSDIYIAIENRSKFNALSSSYKNYSAEQKTIITEQLSEAEVITLEDNYSFNSLVSYAAKVETIGYIIMVAFLLVTILVVFSTMTRLLEEERSQVACLKTLGYSSFVIVLKYLLFSLIATGIGETGAYFIGLGITQLIYKVFTYSFAMPPITGKVAIIFYITALTVIVAGSLCATAITGFKMTKECPAKLLRPKPPKTGEKVILERIPRLWKRLPFKIKSTFRNVMRYKSRFIMTIVSVAFSTALVLTGLSLLDLCLFHDFGSEAIMGISIVIVVFAGFLTAVVIYTLTNINISERSREIATLMVLGYHDKEVSGYIYREVYINTLIGILFGYPISLFLIWLVFNTIGLGSILGVSWFMWLGAPFIVLAFTFFVTIFLRKKIVKINMNDSLKALE